MRCVGLLGVLCCACGGGGGPSFGGGGGDIDDLLDTGERQLIPIRSANNVLTDPSVEACLDQAEIGLVNGDEPPLVVGSYELIGEVVVSESWPLGSAVSSSICLHDQTDRGAIAMREEGESVDIASAHGWIQGEDTEFVIALELLYDDQDFEGCRVQSLAVLGGAVDVQGDLAMRTLAVPVASADCPKGYDPGLGSCWATEVAGVYSGACEG